MEKKYKVIFHIDLNAFFASCEMAENPKLKNIPIGIGGSSDRGVLTTANYEARKYGVKSAMSVVEARRLCPKILMLPVNFELYNKYSNIFFNLLHEYTDIIEKGSIDEGYLDMTDDCSEVHPLDIAAEIQKRLLKEHNLPVSIGVAPNMFLAKMASDMKKPLGITVLRKRDLETKLWPLPIELMFGIGKRTHPNLKLIGINTIGDLVKYKDMRKLKLVLGNRAEYFLELAKGNDKKKVTPDRHADMKSIGTSSTYSSDIYDYQKALTNLSKLTQKVTNRLINDESVTKTISIQVKYNDFTVINRSFTLDFYTDNFYEIYKIVERLFDDNQSEIPIRLLGVSLSNLIPSESNIKQINIFEVPDEKTKEDTVLSLISKINDTYGNKLIKKGARIKK